MVVFDLLRGGGLGGLGMDMNDIFFQMFGMGGMGGMFGGGCGMFRCFRCSFDEEQVYKVMLEEFYKGKIVKFVVEKQVVCSQCKGSGVKEKVVLNLCEKCCGQGVREIFCLFGLGFVC